MTFDTILERLTALVRSRQKDEAKFRGNVTMYVRDAKTSELLLRLRHTNTIVYDGLNMVIRLLAQNAGSGAPATHKITTLRVGTGTTAPTRADVALGAEVFSMTLIDAERFESLGTGELIITKTLGSSEGNVVDPLTEAGLFAANGELFARQIHAPIPKNPAITVTYEWRIGFTA